jgi:dipeptidyl aminopeptidase/acylaminoacyl peptidase
MHRFRFARWTSVVVLGLVAGCNTQAGPGQAANGEVAQTFTPAQYDIADFYNNISIDGASWSPDRQHILVSSNQSGIFNAYTVPAAGGPLQPLTQSTTNSVFAISYFPADERIIYSSDQGGNELTHLYVRNVDGSVVDVTPGTKLKAVFLGWAGDDKSFFIATNERDPRYFDVFSISTDGLKRKLLYKNAAGLGLGPVSRDGRHIALAKLNTTQDADIVLVDVAAQTTKNITTHTGTVKNRAVDFTPDGNKLLLLSDSGGEFSSLLNYDLASGAKAQVYAPSWDVTSARFSKGGKYLVVGVDEDSRWTSRVLDATTFTPVVPTGMPPGLVSSIEIAGNDSAFAFYATDGSTPYDLYAGAFGVAPARITDALNPKIKRQDLVVPTVVRFKSYDSLEIPGVLYRPHQASASARAPAMVLVHGGPGGQATVSYSPMVQGLVNRGYVVFDINNRGSSGYGKSFDMMDDKKHGEADLGDVVESKRMLDQTGYVDSAKIGIIGGSYGGYMTLAAVTLRPDAFKVGVDMFGISNWIRTLESIPPWWTSMRTALYSELGDPKTDSARLRRISPLFNADKIKVPLMVLQGHNDPRVLQVESDQIVAAAKKNGVPVEYIVFPDEGHGFLKKDNEIKGTTAIAAFLDKYLKGGNTVATR